MASAKCDRFECSECNRIRSQGKRSRSSAPRHRGLEPCVAGATQLSRGHFLRVGINPMTAVCIVIAGKVDGWFVAQLHCDVRVWSERMEEFGGSDRALSIRLAPIFFNACHPCHFSVLWPVNRAVEFRAVSTPRNLQPYLEISNCPEQHQLQLDHLSAELSECLLHIAA